MVGAPTRLENWPMGLSAWLDSCRSRAFAWGECDCILFVAKAIEAMSGVNLYDTHIDYDDEAGARQTLKAHGGLEAIISAHLGAPHTARRRARRGDVALMYLPEATAGIVDDSGIKIACMGPSGLRRMPLEYGRKFWSWGG